jgi:hypothetical protein
MGVGMPTIAQRLTELRWSTSDIAARTNQIPLEFGQPGQHGQHQAPVRCGGVGPCVAKGFETGCLGGNRRERVQQVAGGSRQPVKPPAAQQEDEIIKAIAAVRAPLIYLTAKGRLRRPVFKSGLGWGGFAADATTLRPDSEKTP